MNFSRPIRMECGVWHTFSQPGSYLVTLTVRDGYGTGDTNESHRMIHVSSPPTILDDTLFDEEIDLGSSVVLLLSYEDEDIKMGISAYRDTDILYYFDEYGKVPSVVGYLDKIEAEDSEKKRKDLEKEFKRINKCMAGLLAAYKQDPDFEFIKFEGHLPQIIDEETNLVKY